MTAKHRNPRRHAGDIGYFLDNALGACNRLLATAHDRDTHAIAEALRERLVHDRKVAQLAREAAGRDRARDAA